MSSQQNYSQPPPPPQAYVRWLSSPEWILPLPGPSTSRASSFPSGQAGAPAWLTPLISTDAISATASAGFAIPGEGS
ncbi:hypothetical protein PAAG_01636 [Paracoccidioides lutzii Pb01]|uniref:Uncharacterized protein n=1 Tax=Paracoccidioides lutzii (strain ATCC MYA-826 / Pb01) TaxID=502779 RepID=C1GSZ1_PARBA|nr:hypothetical protein PAAG_01636 [Paracoccidioides lutzii Pb01]EEH39174.2 hypothetical protein PAAG_01636 [Paracoccidioides lutzii Pb01]